MCFLTHAYILPETKEDYRMDNKGLKSDYRCGLMLVIPQVYQLNNHPAKRNINPLKAHQHT